MEKVDLATIIQETISAFCRNRIGEKPPIFVTLSPALNQLPSKTPRLREFARRFLYESLLTSDPDTPIQVKLKKRFPLKDINAFVGIEPSCWVHLRVSGRGLRILETAIEELFAEIGYRCEEWLGADDSPARLGIFGALEDGGSKIVFCLEQSRGVVKADLLVPVFEEPAPYLIVRSNVGHAGRN
jgi:hypothetical protein